MQWARPIDNGGSTVIEYKYGYSKTTETCETANTTSEEKMSFTGLEIDQKYQICVKAVSGQNSLFYSETVSYEFTFGTKPDKPTTLVEKVDDRTKSSLGIKWTEPTYVGVAPNKTIEYLVQRTNDAGIWIEQ